VLSTAMATMRSAKVKLAVSDCLDHAEVPRANVGHGDRVGQCCLNYSVTQLRIGRPFYNGQRLTA
jgi:hypothetical protein